MNLETDKNDFNSNRTSSIFSNLFSEEQSKNVNLGNNDNIYNYNTPFMQSNNNNIQFQDNELKYPFILNNDNNSKILRFAYNNNQKINNLSSLENNSRFINYFKMNEDNNNNNPNITSENNNFNNGNNIINNNINSNINNDINRNNIINQNINSNENNNCIYKNLSNNNNYINNSNYDNQNKNFIYNDYLNNLNKIQYLQQNNINNINNNINTCNQINENNISKNEMIIPNDLINKNSNNEEFLSYVNNLNMPLLKYLCTKKGISDMENYLNSHKYYHIEILIYLLNKEGLTKLMKHKFGNYFIQEIIKNAKYPQIKTILDLISQNFVEISESNSGTHVIQTLLNKVNNFELRNLVLKSIENKELEMAFNNNATYVLQKIIGIIPDNERLNMNEIIINNLINLALDSDCVFIVEKFISTITIKENKSRIKEIICQNCIQLATSPFGNYLIQYLFQIWKDDDIEKINNIIIDNANFLAKQRYSSNVIEKAVDTYDIKIKPQLIRSLSLGGDILEIIKNQYGHYVLNKAVKYMSEDLKNEIETILNNQMAEMTKKEKTKSKKFIASLKKNGKNKKNFKNSKK